MPHDITLRTTFNDAAEAYQDVRPRYPKALFDALIRMTHLSKGARLLEVGPGTGQATIPLAKRGYQITAIELSTNMAKVARRELKKYKNVSVITGAFEDVKLPREAFDLIYVATAFHWIKPKAKFIKPHKLLKPKGYFAIIHASHVSDKRSDSFYYAAQPIYKKYEAERNRSSKSPWVSIDDLKPEEVDKKLFKQIFFKAFPMTVTYTADEYIKLLGTYSPNLAMKPARRKEFFKEIKFLINRDFAGNVSKSYAMRLTIAKKK